MKRKIIPVFMCLTAALCMALCGCGGDSFSRIKVQGEQDTSYTVYSNGGSAVQYGNYVYFINGSSGYDDTDGKQNVWPNVVKGGLYRAELNGEKNGADFSPATVKDAATDGLEFKASTALNSEGAPVSVVNVQLIAPKRIGTSGYGEGGIFIYDDWVYFASPNNEKNKSGTVQTSKTDFFRAKLDGSDAERVYTTENDSASSPYAFYKFDGAVYLVAQDGTDVISVRIGKKAGDKTTIATGITNVLLPYSKTYTSGMDENTLNHFVYVLRAVGENDGQKAGNVIEIMRPDGSQGGVYLKQGKADTLEAVRDGLLFYRTTDSAGNAIIAFDNLHDFLMGKNGDTRYQAAHGADRTQFSGTFNAVIGDYTATHCFRPGGEESNLVYMLGFKSGSVDLVSTLGDTISVYDAGATLLRVENEYMYFTDTDAQIIYRTEWSKAAADKSEDEKKQKMSHDDVTSSGFNGDFCAGYVVYFGKADDKAESYTFFRKADAIGLDPVFVGNKISDDILAAPELSVESNELQWNEIEGATSYNVFIIHDGVTELVEKGLTETAYTVADARKGSYYVVAVMGSAVSANSNTVNI